MRNLSKLILASLVLVSAYAGVAHASPGDSTVGVSGYDLVAYHTEGKALRGSGHHVSTHEGVTYLFTSAAHKKVFDRNPGKYLPAYGGYCAFGVSVGKKFVADPEVWRIVDGRLYLNLDADIQKQWLKDIDGRIKKADKEWRRIESIEASEL